MKTIKALFIGPKRFPDEIEIGSMGEGVRELLGGPIQLFMPVERSTVFLCRKSWWVQGLPFNRAIRDPDGTTYGYIDGNFIVCGLNDEDMDIPEMLYWDFPENPMEAWGNLGVSLKDFDLEDAARYGFYVE